MYVCCPSLDKTGWSCWTRASWLAFGSAELQCYIP